VLAVNYEATGFGGINGCLPAKRGSPPLIPPPVASALTAVREAVTEMWAIPPKIISRITTMNAQLNVSFNSHANVFGRTLSLSMKYANRHRPCSQRPPTRV
jgi:hypothetical protein